VTPAEPGGRGTVTGPTPRELLAGRVATVLVGLEALALLGIAAFYVYELVLGHGTDLVVVIMSVVTMLVFVIGLAYTAKGLHVRHPRAQAPAIAVNFLLLPLGIAMFQFAPWWLAALLAVVSVVTIAAVFLMGRLVSPHETGGPAR
jgi:hypothetical protein